MTTYLTKAPFFIYLHGFLVVNEKETTKARKALRFTEKICNYLYSFVFHGSVVKNP